MKCSYALLGAFAVLGLFMDAAQSQDYPSRPIRMVVGFTPGGGTDSAARVMASALAETLRQSVVVDNRPGAGGNVAAQIVESAAPDGHTLLVASGSHTINPLLYKNPPYDAARGFAPIIQLGRSQYLLTVAPSVPARTLKEFIALAKAKPGALNYASSGNGSPPHIATELLKTMTGIDLVHIPFKGTAPLQAALFSGEVQLTFANLAAILPHIQSGKVRGIAVSGPARSPLAPTVPTVAESGVPGFEVNGWYGILAPANTPKAVVDRLYRDSAKALERREVRQQLDNQGLEITALPPNPFSAYIVAELQKWARVVKASGMRVD